MNNSMTGRRQIAVCGVVAAGLAATAALAPAGPQESLPAAAPAATPAGPALATFEQQVSYTLGLNIGGSLRSDGVPVDIPSLAAGIADAISNAEPKLTEAQRRDVMQRFQQTMMQRAQAKLAANQAQGEAFLAANAKKPGVKTTATGLQYKVITQGSGATPTATDSVRCHYEGRLVNGDVFDSSYARGEPAVFPVGRVIAGWTEALQLMKVGDKWELFIPSGIAYGVDGRPPKIGPNETLLFTIELLAIEP